MLEAAADVAAVGGGTAGSDDMKPGLWEQVVLIRSRLQLELHLPWQLVGK